MSDYNRGSFARDLINASRFFVREGDLQMWNKKRSKKSTRHFFLFNDIMLLCKKQGSKRFFLRIHITLRSPYVTTECIDTASFANEFRLHCKTRSFILYATSDEERKAWLADLDMSIKGTHPEELKASGKDPETKKEARQSIAKLPDELPQAKLTASDGRGARSQSATAIPKKKKASQSPNVRMSTVQPSPTQSASPKPPKQRKAKDDLSVRPQSSMLPSDVRVMEGQQLTNDPNLFVYQSPTITNNPFLDLPQQRQFAPQSNPFATNVYSNQQRPQSMIMPQTTSFAVNNQARPQSMVYGANPFATNTSQSSMPNPFATYVQPTSSPNVGVNPNPFATNINTANKPASNPFMTSINQPQQQVNPFATANPYASQPK